MYSIHKIIQHVAKNTIYNFYTVKIIKLFSLFEKCQKCYKKSQRYIFSECLSNDYYEQEKELLWNIMFLKPPTLFPFYFQQNPLKPHPHSY